MTMTDRAGREADPTVCPTCGHQLSPEAERRPARASRATRGTAELELLALVTPVPGAEAMFAAFLARGGKVRHGTKAKPARTGMYPRTLSNLARDWPTGGVPLPTGTHEHDAAWRKRHAGLDRFLSHCEIAGRILRGWATPDGEGQVLTMTLDGLTSAGEWTLTAAEIRYYARGLATGSYVGLVEYGRHHDAMAEVAA